MTDQPKTTAFDRSDLLPPDNPTDPMWSYRMAKLENSDCEAGALAQSPVQQTTPAPIYPTAGDAWLGLWPAMKPGASGDRERLDVVVRCLDRLYRRRRIAMAHARILRVYGDLGRCPDHRESTEREDARLWAEVTKALEMPLRSKGIVT